MLSPPGPRCRVIANPVILPAVMLKSVLLVGAVALIAFLVISQLRAAANRVDAETARRLVNEGAVLLDVRTPGEFSAGHIDGAVNIPVQELGSRLNELDVASPVVVYCRSGQRSSFAAGTLKNAGFASVSDLGPMSAW